MGKGLMIEGKFRQQMFFSLGQKWFHFHGLQSNSVSGFYEHLF